MIDRLVIDVNDETAPLASVVLGIAENRGPVSGNNPKARHHIKMGTLPTDEDLEREFDGFRAALEAQGVQVYRPKDIVGLTQMYARDIAFVIGRKI
ncbi:amidinotransferase, partial [Candidatus Woesearchaeota archaeon]|nr:amidinotransferase [Candidatus Woesearchaeota archaeon]